MTRKQRLLTALRRTWKTFNFIEDCPACYYQALKMAQGLKETVVVDGERRPRSTTYYLCEHCGARFRHRNGGPYEIPSDKDWQHDVTDCGHGQ